MGGHSQFRREKVPGRRRRFSSQGKGFPTASGRNYLVFGNMLPSPDGEKTTRMGKQLLLFSRDMGRRVLGTGGAEIVLYIMPTFENR
jgi:hypothetical protein